MHELSIVQSLVAGVEETARREGARRVTRVHIRVGALSGVVADALRFSYDIGTAGTLLAGSVLEIEELPVLLHCAGCARAVEAPVPLRLRCPVCDASTADVRQGRELDITRVELELPD